MNRKYKVFIILVGSSFVLLTVFFVLMNNRKKAIQRPSSSYSRILKQSPYRSVKEFKNTRAFKSIFAQDDKIIALDETGTLTLFDSKLKKLKELPKSGILQNRILDVFVQKNDEYLILDGTSGGVFKRTSDSTIRIYQSPFQIIRGEFIDENNILIKASLPDNPDTVRFMNLFIPSGKIELLKVDEPNVEYPDMTLDGFLVSGVNNILHVCYKTGLFSCFSNTGKFQYTTTTIDQSAPPIILVSEHGTKRYNPYSTTINIHATSDDEIIYILSNSRSLNDISIKNVVDCYSIKDGGYLYSLTLEDEKSLFGIIKLGSNLIGFRGSQILILKSDE